MLGDVSPSSSCLNLGLLGFFSTGTSKVFCSAPVLSFSWVPKNLLQPKEKFLRVSKRMKKKKKKSEIFALISRSLNSF